MFGAIAGGIASALADRKSGSAGMPRPISYAVFCLKKKQDDYTLIPLPSFISFSFHATFTIDIYTLSLPRRSSDLFMVWSNFTATKCRGLVSLNQVIKEIICLQPLK